jgi:hypothetical protein
MQGYRMPESYETAEGKLDLAKREAALMERYQEVSQWSRGSPLPHPCQYVR